jgi:hypothetical protein
MYCAYESFNDIQEEDNVYIYKTAYIFANNF